jgi:HEAT repeat protein
MRRRSFAVPAALAALALAAVALASCAPAHDARDLLQGLQSPDSDVRQDAKEKIADVLRDGEYEVFVRGAREADGMVRVQSILYLARFSDPGAREELRGLLRIENRGMIPYSPIRMRIASEPTDSRILVANLIAQNGGDPEAVDDLLAGMKTPQPREIVTGTCYALGALRDPRGVAYLKAATTHGDTAVVRAAIEALARIKGPEALAALQGLADHPAVEVRTDLLLALDLRDDAGPTGVVRRLALGDPDAGVRSQATQQIGRGPAAEAVPVLIQALKDRDTAVRAAAHEALVRIAGTSLPPRPEAWSRWWSANQARFAPPAGGQAGG